MRWAITPRGAGHPVGFRAINSDGELQAGEFASTTDPAGLVLAQDGTSLRAATNLEQLTAAKRAKVLELQLERARRIYSEDVVVQFAGRSWPAHQEARINAIENILGLFVVAGLPPEALQNLPFQVPEAVTWTDDDDDDAEFSFEQSFLLFAAMAQHKLQTFAAYRQARDAVLAIEIVNNDLAAALAAVRAVEWPT